MEAAQRRDIVGRIIESTVSMSAEACTTKVFSERARATRAPEFYFGRILKRGRA